MPSVATETHPRATRSSPASVAVVGGGIVGLATAWSLRRRGAEVTVFERGRCGGAASAGNAGWVTPGLSHPVPGPGVLPQALRWMLDPESPFLIRPRLDAGLAAWGLRFARACTRARQRDGLVATYALARSSTDGFDAMAADGVAFEQHPDGLLYLVCDERELDHWEHAYAELAELGFDGQLERFDRAALERFEPAVGPRVRAGLLARAERHVRPETVCAGLVAHLRDAGVAIEEDVEISELVARRDGWSVRTAAGSAGFDQVVVAAGAWSRELLGRLGVRLPMEAAKGYSVTAPADGPPPRRPLYLTEAKIGVSPFDGALRFAGTLELAGVDVALNRRRLAAVVRGAAGYLDGVAHADGAVEWAGLRPLPADGLPIVGAVAERSGLHVATGHGMLGVTLAPATGEALARLMLSEHEVPELAGLSPDRFARGPRHPAGPGQCARGLGVQVR